MYKAMIVDDDILAREKLKRLLEEREVFVCAEAVNGLSALQMLDSMQPDILFIDVKMPVMDGVELSGHVAERYPQIKMVMLSSYDDYDYVRDSMRNGAFDYILKHRLNAKAVEAQIDKLGEELAHQSRLNEMSDAKDRMPLISSMAKREFLRALLTGSLDAADSVAAALTLRIAPTNLYVALLRLEPPQLVLPPENLQRMAQSVVTMCDQFLEEKGTGEIVQMRDGELAVLLSFPGLYSDMAVEQSRAQLLRELGELVARYFNWTPDFACSGRLGSYRDAAEFYRSMQPAEETVQLLALVQDKALSDYVRQAMEFVHRNYAENISLGDAAGQADISPNYLSRLFKNECGLSFVEYLNRVRVGHAKELLAKRGKSVKKIAALVGYSNYNYFFKVFKEIEGETPSTYAGKFKL